MAVGPILHPVAPLMGAWIETARPAYFKKEVNVSHLSWVRGLKLLADGQRQTALTGRTSHGCVD